MCLSGWTSSSSKRTAKMAAPETCCRPGFHDVCGGCAWGRWDRGKSNMLNWESFRLVPAEEDVRFNKHC